MATDLSFENLQAVTGVTANTFVLDTGKVMIDVSLLTGKTVDTLADEIVTEACFKLLEIAKKAQENYNATVLQGDPIFTSFGTTSIGTPQNINNTFLVNKTVGLTVKINLTESTITQLTQ